MINLQTNKENKEYLIKVLHSLIKEVQKSPEIYKADFQTGTYDDIQLYEATGIRRTLSKTYDIHLEIK